MSKRKIFLIILTIFIGCYPAFGGSKTFDEIFKLEDVIKLPQLLGVDPDANEIERDGRIWISVGGSGKNEVRIYTPEGELINAISQKDLPRPKGYPYMVFTDIAVDKNRRAFILDVVSGNAFVVDSVGKFLNYFGAKRDYDNYCCVGGGSLKIDKEGNVYFGGACYQAKKNKCPESKGFCLHKYNPEGKYIKSFFPLEKKLFELTTDPSGDPSFHHAHFDLDQEGNIWCVHQMVYEIFKYSPEGKLLQKFKGKSSLYKPPPKIPSAKSQNVEEVWRNLWTPITNIVALKPNLILICFDSYSKNGRETYLEIYDENGNVLVPDIPINRMLFGKDTDDYLYFSIPESDMKKESQGYLMIGKFSLNLKE